LLSNRESDFSAQAALTWSPGQWHPTANRYRVLRVPRTCVLAGPCIIQRIIPSLTARSSESRQREASLVGCAYGEAWRGDGSSLHRIAQYARSCCLSPRRSHGVPAGAENFHISLCPKKGMGVGVTRLYIPENLKQPRQIQRTLGRSPALHPFLDGISDGRGRQNQ
jgi:hypothetical protein